MQLQKHNSLDTITSWTNLHFPMQIPVNKKNWDFAYYKHRYPALPLFWQTSSSPIDNPECTVYNYITRLAVTNHRSWMNYYFTHWLVLTNFKGWSLAHLALSVLTIPPHSLAVTMTCKGRSLCPQNRSIVAALTPQWGLRCAARSPPDSGSKRNPSSSSP